MKCTCCGKEVLPNERFCNFCGQNNDEYVDDHKEQPTSNPHITQPINKVPIYPNQNQNTYYQPPQNNSYYQTPPQNTPLSNYQYPYENTGYQAPPQNNVKEPSIALAIMALIFSSLGGWLGLVFSIIGLCKYKKPAGRIMCRIGIALSAIWFVIGFIIGFSSFF